MNLVMLLIITVLVLSSVQTTILQERMAQIFRDVNVAFQSIESALKGAKSLPEPSIALTILTQLVPLVPAFTTNSTTPSFRITVYGSDTAHEMIQRIYGKRF
jgi:type IV pilus assembly protein PilX